MAIKLVFRTKSQVRIIISQEKPLPFSFINDAKICNFIDKNTKTKIVLH